MGSAPGKAGSRWFSPAFKSQKYLLRAGTEPATPIVQLRKIGKAALDRLLLRLFNLRQSLRQAVLRFTFILVPSR